MYVKNINFQLPHIDITFLVFSVLKIVFNRLITFGHYNRIQKHSCTYFAYILLKRFERTWCMVSSLYMV